jgi:hypothetical protein
MRPPGDASAGQKRFLPGADCGTWAILGFIYSVSADRSGNSPKYLAELHASVMHYVLPHRREERIYPRAIRLKSPKYPIRNKNASQLD